MRKKIFQNTTIMSVTTAAIVLLSCAVKNIPQQKYSTLKQEGLNGSVHIMERRSYTFDSLTKTLKEDTFCINRFEYDKKGNNIKN